MSDEEDEITLSRRRILGGVATIGAASAAAGAGAFAAFSDSESASGSIQAGTLDLEIVSQNGQSYDGGPGNVTFLDEAGVVPGNSGESTVTVKNAGSLTGYLDVGVVSVTDKENGVQEPEEDVDPDGSASGELADALDVQAWVDGPRGTSYLCPSFDGKEPLSSVFVTGEVHSLNYRLEPGEEATFHLDWLLPDSVGNEVQSDIAGLDLAFQFDQNPDDNGTATCQPSDDGDSGDGGDDGDGDTGAGSGRDAMGGWDWATELRYGKPDDQQVNGNSEKENWEVGFFKATGSGQERKHKANQHLQYPWENGTAVSFEVSFDEGTVTPKVENRSYPENGEEGGQGVPGEEVVELAVTATAEATGSSASVTNLTLSSDDESQSLSAVTEDGPGDGQTSTHTTVDLDEAEEFTLSGNLTFDWDSGSPPSPHELKVRVDARRETDD
jgi:predicted ribosomally synthesized peptide with SipW-like signal peptide